MRTPHSMRGVSILEIMVVLSLIVVLTGAILIPAVGKASRQKQATTFVDGVLSMSIAIRDGYANRETYAGVSTASINEAGWIPPALQPEGQPDYGISPWGLRWWVTPQSTEAPAELMDSFAFTFSIEDRALCAEILSRLAPSARRLWILEGPQIVDFAPTQTTTAQAQINVRNACKALEGQVNAVYWTL